MNRQQQFANSLARAQRLMLDENFNNAVEAKARMQSKGGGAAVDLKAFEAQAFGDAYQNNKPIQMLQETTQQQMQDYNMQNSKLPQSILESIRKQPLMSGQQSQMDSVIGQMVPQMQVNEQYTAPQTLSTNGSIDYNALKYIINECIKENLSAMKSSLLNESAASFRGVKMCSGNKIQFLDSKGNLYEGVLQFKRKVTK